jgi:hypothetical protein
MRLSIVGSAVVALGLALGSGAVFAAAEDKPAAEKPAEQTPADQKSDDATSKEILDRIFDRKHLSNVDAGKELVYKFHRTVSNPDLLGQAFNDDITLKVNAAKPDGGRDVDLQIYTGDRARDLQKMPDRLHNPVLLVYFNQAVNTFHMLAGGQSPYLTRVFSTALRDKAKIEPIKITYDGKQVDAYRISMTPYKGDQAQAKMQGWEGAQYIMVVSDQVPGQVVDLVSEYQNKYNEKNLRLVERITLDGVDGLDDIK